jgi:predicted DCC family thiol-disulfide oxidoreductase YuxK
MNIVLFDGICNLSNSTVSFLIKHDAGQNLHFSAQQSQAGKKIMQANGIREDNKSVIFIQDNIVYYKSDAIIAIAKIIRGWPRILQYSYIIPKLLRNALYDMIAHNRYWIFGKKSACSTPTKEDKHRFL